MKIIFIEYKFYSITRANITYLSSSFTSFFFFFDFLKIFSLILNLIAKYAAKVQIVSIVKDATNFSPTIPYYYEMFVIFFHIVKKHRSKE